MKLNYWQQRFKHQQDVIRDATEAELSLRIAAAYKDTLKGVQQDMIDLYSSLLEASENGEIKTIDLYKFNRLYDLENKLAERLTALGHKETALYQERFKDYYHKVQDCIEASNPQFLNNTYSFTVGVDGAESAVKNIWCADGLHWSDRVWRNKALLQERIEKGLIDCVSRGLTKDLLIKQLMNDFSVGFHVAERLVRTELTVIYTTASKDRYLESGLTYYEYCASQQEDDNEPCKKLDGKIFRLDEMKVGENAPPKHPFVNVVSFLF